MAIYHCSIKIISRGKGKSAVAAAAYRAGERFTNEYDGLEHDYSRKGGVVHTEILLPANAPAGYSDRAVLWNAVEKIEKAKNSQLAREIELALPIELSREQNIALVRDYAHRHFVEAGMCADICIHDKGDGNPHAHIMLSLRPIREDGTWGDKQKKEYIFDRDGNKIYDKKKRSYKCKSIPSTDWNDHAKAEVWRQGWADAVNAALERGGHAERIDHRSYERQGIDLIPSVHLGIAAFQMERRGIATDRGNLNREIEITNSQLRQLRARIIKLSDWLKDEAANAAPPTLADVIHGILEKREGQGRYAQIANLKSAANMLIFLQLNDIKDMAGLQEKVSAIYARFGGARDALKKNERRTKTLGEHIKHAEAYFKHKELFGQYRQIQNPKKREAFYERHRVELAGFEEAREYLKKVMNGRNSIPVQAWKAEAAKLAAERKSLYLEYNSIKEEVREVEAVRRGVEDIWRSEARDVQRERAREVER